MPEMALAGMAIIVILADLVLKRRDLLAPLSLIGLAVPVALTIVLWLKLDSIDPHALSGFSGFFVVDYFSLFFKFLILGATALVIMASRESVTRFSRFQGEYYQVDIRGFHVPHAPVRDRIPIYAAAMGPGMCRQTAEVADGRLPG